MWLAKHSDEAGAASAGGRCCAGDLQQAHLPTSVARVPLLGCSSASKAAMQGPRPTAATHTHTQTQHTAAMTGRQVTAGATAQQRAIPSHTAHNQWHALSWSLAHWFGSCCSSNCQPEGIGVQLRVCPPPVTMQILCFGALLLVNPAMLLRLYPPAPLASRE